MRRATGALGLACVALVATVALASAAALNHAPVAHEDRTRFGREQTVHHPNPADDDWFGSEVAVSGGTALVGTPYHRVGSDNGGVTMFVRAGTRWEHARTFLGESQGGSSAGSFDIDGDRMVLTRTFWGETDPDFGAAGEIAVWERSGGEWRKAASLTPNLPSWVDAWTPGHVSLSGDTIVVSAYLVRLDGAGNEWGSALYAFRKSGGSWAQAVIPTPAQSPLRLTLYGEVSGDTIVAAGQDPVEGHLNVSVYVRNGNSWSREATLPVTLSDEEGGNDLAIDGDTIATGDGSNGRIAIFVRSGGSWVKRSSPTHSPKGLYFGGSLDLDGDTLVVGDNMFKPGFGFGAAWAFVRNGGAWRQIAYFPSSIEGGDFGGAIAVSGDTVLVGNRLTSTRPDRPGLAKFVATAPYTTGGVVRLNVGAPGVLGNDTDADGDALTAVLESGPAHGSLRLRADGSFSYDPDRGWAGADSFRYRASDGDRRSAAVTVRISVARPGETGGGDAGGDGEALGDSADDGGSDDASETAGEPSGSGPATDTAATEASATAAPGTGGGGSTGGGSDSERDRRGSTLVWWCVGGGLLLAAAGALAWLLRQRGGAPTDA